MPILTHGSDMRLAASLGAVVRGDERAAGTVRGAIDLLSDAGFSAFQLDAALPGLRPRDLTARGRKDLLALAARRNMAVAGIDLFIPRRHYVEPAHLDRAIAATAAAVELAADLGRVPLSISLPIDSIADDAKAALVESADGRGVRLAVHAEDHLDKLLAWVEKIDRYSLGIGIDPAALLMAAANPLDAVQRVGKRLAVARLDDVTSGGAGGSRCPVGAGELDVVQYRVLVDLAAARTGPVVLDLAGVAKPMQAAAAARKAWDNAAFRV